MTVFNRIFFGSWALLFLLFAYWQGNDPDPFIWILIYGYAAIISAIASTGRCPKIMLFIGILLGVAGFLYMYPGEVSSWISSELEQKDLSMKSPHMEEARESFGLLIVSVISGIAYLTCQNRNRRFRR